MTRPWRTLLCELKYRMEPLLSALKDEEVVPELRLKVIRSLTKMAQFSRIRDTLFEVRLTS